MIEKIRLKLKSYDYKILDKTISDIIFAVSRNGSNIHGPIPLPTKIERFIVNRSTNIDKKSREQFEIKHHNRMLYIESHGNIVEALMKTEAPAGVDIEIKIH